MQFPFQIRHIVFRFARLIFYTRDTILVIFKAIKEYRMQIVPCGFLHEYFYVSVVMIVWIKKVRE